MSLYFQTASETVSEWIVSTVCLVGGGSEFADYQLALSNVNKVIY